MEFLLIQIVILIIFIILIWPHVKNEQWKEKFIKDKHAKSLLIVFTLILLTSVGLGVFFDTFFPVERLD